MSNLAQSEYANNLHIIRTNFGKTQIEMSLILDVTESMYRRYEKWTRPFPLERAKMLAKEFNLSLDYIYGLSEKDDRQTDNFMVDIREMINIDEDNNVVFAINKSHINYLFSCGKIKTNSRTNQKEKRYLIAQLNGSYSFVDNSIVMQYKIPYEKFMSYYKSENGEIPYCFDETETISHEYTQ